MIVQPSQRVLVCGATGRHGGTGRAVVETLLAKGVAVRALVRRQDDRAALLQSIGAEIVEGDFSDFASLLRALEDIRSAYFCFPVAQGIADAAGLFAAAGKKQGLIRIVDLSLGSTSPTALSPQVRAQWVAEQIFEWAGFTGTHLRVAAFFLENIALIDGPAIRRTAQIRNAFGAAPLSWISGADVGRMAAALLLDPSLCSERTLVVGGSESFTYAEIAATIASVTGRPVAYHELSPDQWHGELVSAITASGRADTRAADHLVAQARMIQNRTPVIIPDRVQRLTGNPPIGLRRFIENRISDFHSTDSAV